MKLVKSTILVTAATVILAGVSLSLWAVLIGLTKLGEVNHLHGIMKRLEVQDA
jgi:predicted benzoate:H+ symporter BenE